jgi:hypothetical protein
MKEQFFYLYKLKAYSLLLCNAAILLLLNRIVGKGDFFLVIKSLLTFNCLARSGTSFGSPC